MREREMRSPKRDIFVPVGGEREYAQKLGIEYRKLDNGIVLLGVHKEVTDRKHVGVEFTFPSGSAADPKGKEGIHHFVEHLVSNRVGLQTYAGGVVFEAQTSIYNFSLSIHQAIMDPDRKDIGVWPAMDNIKQLVDNPLGDIDNISEAIRKERSIILGEIAEHSLRQDIESLAYPFLFASDNPLSKHPLGTPSSIQSFTPNDVRDAATSIFQPEGLVISALGESSDRTHTKKVIDSLEELFSPYQGSTTRENPTNSLNIDKLNPQLPPGGALIIDSKGDLNHVSWVWELPFEKYSLEERALVEFTKLISIKLFNFSRSNGLGYTSTAQLFPVDKKVLLLLSLNIATSVASQDKIIRNLLIHPISDLVINKVTEQEVDLHLKRKQIERDLIPLSQDKIYAMLHGGLIDKQRLVDIHEVIKREKDIDTKTITQWQKRLCDQEPTVIMFAI